MSDDTDISEDLKDLWFERPGVVFERGKPGSWDDYGVRDPAPLVDLNGRLVYEGGFAVLYYTGSCKKGTWQGIGRAVSSDGGRVWQRQPYSPIFFPIKNGWDSGITSTPWVIKDDNGCYRIYYRGAKAIYKDEAIGLALSKDGIHFERCGTRPILTKNDFVDIPKKGKMFMGVINVIRTISGRYLLVFEGCSVSHGRTEQIFGAVSDDGKYFKPLNGGYPVFSANNVRRWPVLKVANPRITVLEDKGIYMLAFNGQYRSGFWAVGAAFTKDFKEWQEHPDNPLILPSAEPLVSPFSGRIEGAVFIKEDIEQRRNPVRVFLMGIPRKGPSHKGAAIGLARGYIGDSRAKYNFKIISDKSTDAEVSLSDDNKSETIQLNPGYDSVFPPQVFISVFDKGRLQKFSVNFFLKKTSSGVAFIVLGDDIGSLNTIEGIRIGFESGKVFLWPGFSSNTLQGLIQKIIIKYRISMLRWFKWRFLCFCAQDSWHSFCMQRENKREWALKLDDRYLKNLTLSSYAPADIYSIGIKCLEQPIKLHNLQILVSQA